MDTTRKPQIQPDSGLDDVGDGVIKDPQDKMLAVKERGRRG